MKTIRPILLLLALLALTGCATTDTYTIPQPPPIELAPAP